MHCGDQTKKTNIPFQGLRVRVRVRLTLNAQQANRDPSMQVYALFVEVIPKKTKIPFRGHLDVAIIISYKYSLALVRFSMECIKLIRVST